jgi:D-serine deaminase-like pyridoxal phosphate-dependent protein
VLKLTDYAIENAESIPTPALLIYTDRVDDNIRAVIAQCGGDASRWRPHVKTAKARDIMARYLAHGVTRFKCATTKELRVLLDLEAPDVLLSFPVVGATAARVRELAATHPKSRVSVLVETREHLAPYAGTGLGVFIDCNSGMDRTGRDPSNVEALANLATEVESLGCVFRGLHWYDGHLHISDLTERERVAHEGYQRLETLVSRLASHSRAVREVIVAGTPAAPCALSYPKWSAISGNVQISPGTVVYNDTTSLDALPASWALAPAALVLATVVSHPRDGRFTCDAGHKAVSADAGVPTCAILGHEDWIPSKPSEEHLPVDCPAGSVPDIGSSLLLIPRHVCPTVNNFDEALLVSNGVVQATALITARGHDGILA